MATINAFYREHAMEYATVSEDGMTITLPSEKKADTCYEVRCEHTANGVEAVSCQCWGFVRWGHCKHLTIVQAWQDAKAPAETKITEIEAGSWYILNSDTQVWRDTETGQWFAVGPTANAVEIVEAHLAVREAEQIVATPVVEVVEVAPVVVEVPAKSDSAKLSRILATQKVDIGLVGTLTRSQGFQLMR